jgi:glycosyltransferase involved in cell wall biosynthesis
MGWKAVNGKPCVSVITPAYNAANFLPETIESILNQTFSDFEYIIVDDASEDETWQIILRYANLDSRIIPLQNKHNMNATVTRNYASTLARGEYIAAQDADDISLPLRLERQVTYLDSHPEIGVSGVLVNYVDSERRTIAKQRPLGELDAIHASMLFASPFLHTTLTMRRKIFEQVGGYDAKYMYADDPELLWRMSRLCKIGVIQEILCEYRIHNSQDRMSNNPLNQHKTYAEVSTRSMDQWLNSPTFPAEAYKRLWSVTHHHRIGELKRGDIARLTEVWSALAADEKYRKYYKSHLIKCHRILLRHYPGEAMQLATILRTKFQVSNKILFIHYYKRFCPEWLQHLLSKHFLYRGNPASVKSETI